MIADKVWLEQWRRIAELRGFRQDFDGWRSPGGHRVSAEFVQRMCSDPPPSVVVEEQHRAMGAA